MQKLSSLIIIITIALIPVAAHAQTDMPLFFKNLKIILAGSEAKDFSHIKGELLSPPEYLTKEYDCTVKLEGFATTFKEKNGMLVFGAVTVNYRTANGKALLDKEVRDKSGFEGYINENYTGDNPGSTTEKFETMTLLSKKGSTENLLVCKRRNGAGYRLYIMSDK